MSSNPLNEDESNAISRRRFMRLSGSVGAFMALSGLPVFRASAAPNRCQKSPLVASDQVTRLWYTTPGTDDLDPANSESSILLDGLPIGNGRFGGLVNSDPARDALYIVDQTLWTGGLNEALVDNQGIPGQFSYDTSPEGFGVLTVLAKGIINVPAHSLSAVSNYERQLDLTNGFVSARYQLGGVTYQRQVYASHPDDVIVMYLTQSGGGNYTGTIELNGTHGETTTANSKTNAASFNGTLGNGLNYAAALTATTRRGTIGVDGGVVTFTSCSDLLIIIAGGTNYSQDASSGFQDSSIVPLTVALEKVSAAATVDGTTLLYSQVEDYRALYSTFSINLGASSAAQRSLDTASRLAARTASGAVPDPELEASFVQFGRYLMICCSRHLPSGLQGIWLTQNNSPWMGDYHSDINLEMSYWLPDRTSLSPCFDAFTNYCLSQVPCWTKTTQALFNDPQNAFANSSGKIAGWTIAISTNINGGFGWWWHVAGGAWLCNELYNHYLYTQDLRYLERIYPLLKGAGEFWEARLITAIVTDSSGGTRQVLIDDVDWSPEHGPTNAKGITYAQELVWQLFENYLEAAKILGLDSGYATTIAGLQSQLYLPEVSPVTGWLEEWMSPDDLANDPTHRHLSPLIGFFPGDRLAYDTMPQDILAGVTNLLTARGMTSYGWGVAWRSICWARLKNSVNAYQEYLNVIQLSTNWSDGISINFFDVYEFGSNNGAFQIDANFGGPTAVVEMLLYSRPGLIELLPALPSAWAASGQVKGIGARGGFRIDLAWANSQVTAVTIHSTGGTSTTVKFGNWTKEIELYPGRSTTLHPPPTTTVFTLINLADGRALEVPQAATAAGVGLVVDRTRENQPDQQWRFTTIGGGLYKITNVNSGLIIDADGSSNTSGATVIQSQDTGRASQHWALVEVDHEHYKIINRASGLLLSVQDKSEDTSVVIQSPDTGDRSQQWRRTYRG